LNTGRLSRSNPHHRVPEERPYLRTVPAAALAAALFLTGLLGLAGCAGTTAGEPKVAEPRRNGDFGIPDGTCNRRAVGAVLGGAIGGIIGAQVGEGASRRIAILAGAAAGSLIGAHIGRRMDEADRACIGEALEKAGDNRTVAWVSDDGGTAYRVTPLASRPNTDPACRMFELEARTRAESTTSKAQACRDPDGTWRVIE
jgi:surface antigen